jgi:hypothetical protein
VRLDFGQEKDFCHVFAKNPGKGSYCSQKDREHHPINGVHCLFEDESFSLPVLNGAGCSGFDKD